METVLRTLRESSKERRAAKQQAAADGRNWRYFLAEGAVLRCDAASFGSRLEVYRAKSGWVPFDNLKTLIYDTWEMTPGEAEKHIAWEDTNAPVS